MHRLSWLALCGLLVGFPALATDRGDTLAQATEAGQAELTVLFVSSGGWAYRDPAGRPAGVTVEIMQRFADWAGAEVGVDPSLTWVEESDWSRFYRRVQDASGGVFGLGNVTITEARRAEIAFSPPYVSNVAVLISHDRHAALASPAELAEHFDGLKALAFEGTLHEERLRRLADQHWAGMPLSFSRSNDDILDRVASGRYFAYIDAYNFYRAREQGAPLKHHPVLDDAGEQFGIVMPLDNDWQDLLAAFFDAHGGLVGSDWYRELLARHLGSGVAATLLDSAD